MPRPHGLYATEEGDCTWAILPPGADRCLVVGIDEGEQQLAAAYADAGLAEATAAARQPAHPAAACPALHATRARRALMLQLLVHDLCALRVGGGGGQQSGGGGGGGGEPRVAGMDAGACEIAAIVARAAERRGEQFGAAPGATTCAPSVSLLEGVAAGVQMARLRLARSVRACVFA